MADRARRRRLFVPEVVQASAMDCGPAALDAVLAGHGIAVGHGRLREACQTGLDGTSIDTVEDVANLLGLVAEQTIMPPDQLLLPQAQALPAIAIVRSGGGATHFVVLWRRHGRWVQVMDPAIGRRWLPIDRLLADLYRHAMPIPAATWREHAGSEDFAAVLRARLRALGLRRADADARIAAALEDPSSRSIAALDATTRMLARWRQAGAVSGGRAIGRLLDRATAPDAVPDAYWSVAPAEPDAEGEPQVQLRGAVLVRILGARPTAEPAPPLSPELAAALAEPPARPGRALLRLVRAGGLLAPAIVLAALAIAALGVVFEALLFRGLFDLAHDLGTRQQRVGAAAAFVLFATGLLALELPMVAAVLRIGRHLEVRAREAFLAKIPRLYDRHFESRLKSDMAERSHGVHVLRNLPVLAAEGCRAVFGLLMTTAGIAWLDPRGGWLAVVAAAVSLALPMLVHPVLAERDLRVRTHLGAMSRFYLDALLGLVPIRAHGAQRAVRREHEALMLQWRSAAQAVVRAVVASESIQALVGTALAIALLASHLGRGGSPGAALLLVWWALSLPVLAQRLALVARQYPSARAIVLRLLEPLGAPERPAVAAAAADGSADPDAVAIALAGVTVRAGGHTILDAIDLRIDAGAHVAIVGVSGAGKSSLVGVLLGWHRPVAGEVTIDGRPLDDAAQARLRQDTAWVDPAVQLWNRSLLDNLHYGVPAIDPEHIAGVVDDAALKATLERLPEGLQTRLGEGGASVSGGEGQRVRLARALLRPGVRLAILDEAFRGLDREHRRRLLARARQRWSSATLLCITHDVGETLGFARVLVLRDGRIVEDGVPAELAADPDSAYARLLQHEQDVREDLWRAAGWRRLWMRDGVLTPEAEA